MQQTELDGKLTQSAKELILRIEGQISMPPQVDARAAAAAVLCVLTRRLSGGEAQHVYRRVPATLRPWFNHCVLHREERAERFGLEGFVNQVADHLQVPEPQALIVTKAVFDVLREQLPREEIRHVRSQLPPDIRDLWSPEPIEPPSRPRSFDAAMTAAPRLDVQVHHPLAYAVEARVLLPPAVTGAGAFAATMCAMTLRLTRGEALHVRDALPDALRALLDGCTLHRSEEGARFTRSEFISRLAEQLDAPASDAERIASVVFDEVRRYLPDDVVAHVTMQLPSDLKDLWRGRRARGAA